MHCIKLDTLNQSMLGCIKLFNVLNAHAFFLGKCRSVCFMNSPPYFIPLAPIVKLLLCFLWVCLCKMCRSTQQFPAMGEIDCTCLCHAKVELKRLKTDSYYLCKDLEISFSFYWISHPLMSFILRFQSRKQL